MDTQRWSPDARIVRHLPQLDALYNALERTPGRDPDNLNESTGVGDTVSFGEGYSSYSPLPSRATPQRQADNRLLVHCMAAMASNCEFDSGKFRNLLFHECLETSDVQGTPAWWEEIHRLMDDFGPLTLTWNDKKKKPSRENMGLDSDDMTALRDRCGASLFPYVYIFFLMRFLGPLPDNTDDFTGWEVSADVPTAPKNEESAWTKAGFKELAHTMKILLRIPDYVKPKQGIVTKHWMTRIFAWAFTVSLFPKMSTSVTLAETSEECFVAEHINSVATLAWRLLPKQRTRDGWFQGLLDMKVYDASALTPNDIQLESEDVLDGINAKLGEARSAHLRPALIQNGEHALARVDAVHLYVGMAVFLHHDLGQFRSMRIISDIVLGVEPSIVTTLPDGTDQRVSSCSPWDRSEDEDPSVFDDARLFTPSAHPEVRFTALAMRRLCVT